MNEAIALGSLLMGTIYALVTIILFIKSTTPRRTWPLPAMIILAGGFGAAGAVILWNWALRKWDMPWIFHDNGAFSLILRIVGILAGAFLLVAISSNRLLNDNDRDRAASRRNRRPG